MPSKYGRGILGIFLDSEVLANRGWKVATAPKGTMFGQERLFESFAFFGVSGCSGLIEPTAVHTSFHRHIHTTPQLFLCPTHYPFPTTLPSSGLNTPNFSRFTTHWIYPTDSDGGWSLFFRLLTIVAGSISSVCLPLSVQSPMLLQSRTVGCVTRMLRLFVEKPWYRLGGLWPWSDAPTNEGCYDV
ncbi:hypothetical protein BT96DRAFT_48298 [Gymnopus androsaceus JB14]|uniref:Uncharacterized protein n=1 Tax=Gymnopus androsaceus JB14 TaxID=1447944 RepID=A0A6A4HLH3_9AGAR|nr:hypothetical protein BT96DRAFT_48298 [Gymnopus androsaceus JB14]